MVILLSATALVGLLAAFAVIRRLPRQPNVILITVDTLRADHLGVYGYRRNTSPHVDRFAQDAIVFRWAFCHAPTTRPALSSLMTSFYPHETKVRWNKHVLQAEVVTLAEILRAKDYHTAAFVSSFLLRRGSGFEQGFEVYDDRTEDALPTLSGWGLQRLALDTTRAVVRWLEGNHQTPFFLWVHYMDPHGPYTPPPPYHTLFVEESTEVTATLPINENQSGVGGIPRYQRLGAHRDAAYYVSQYDGEIRFLDQAFGVLIDKLKELRLLERSLILFTADHGEGMGQHNYYFGHRDFLYNELIHVPLIVRLPGHSSEAKEIGYPVGHVDIVPTILELLSIKTSQPFRGRHLLEPHEREIFAETSETFRRYALAFNGLKLIVDQTGHRRDELYDVRKDPLETVNMLGPALDESLAASITEWQTRLNAIRQDDALRLGKPMAWDVDGEVNKLRALGYLQ